VPGEFEFPFPRSLTSRGWDLPWAPGPPVDAARLVGRLKRLGFACRARKVDVRLPGKSWQNRLGKRGNSNSHVARQVHQIISIRTSRLSIKKSLSGLTARTPPRAKRGAGGAGRRRRAPRPRPGAARIARGTRGAGCEVPRSGRGSGKSRRMRRSRAAEGEEDEAPPCPPAASPCAAPPGAMRRLRRLNCLFPVALWLRLGGAMRARGAGMARMWRRALMALP